MMVKGENLKKDIEQEAQHLKWLQSFGFDIESLELGKWVKCCGTQETKPTGAFVYRTFVNELRQGGYGFVTLSEIHGEKREHRTLPRLTEEPAPSFFRLSALPSKESGQLTEAHKEAARKAGVIWQNSSSYGVSDYLIRKSVGFYGIRFKENKHGRVAVVPVRDIEGRLWSIQFLNANGSKIFFPGGRTQGMFHCIAPIIDSQPFGIAESYVTAATCYELSGIPMVCAFRCNNIEAVTIELRKKYPKSPIVFFADNDRHSAVEGKENQGIIKAKQACKVVEGRTVLAFPEFDTPPAEDAKDWNDLFRLQGAEKTREQIKSFLDNLYQL